MIRDVEESLQIYLNSKYANRYNASTSDVDYYFSPFSIPTQYHIHLSVVSAQIPYSFYNVNIRNNNDMNMNMKNNLFNEKVNNDNKESTFYLSSSIPVTSSSIQSSSSIPSSSSSS
jgi:hypothetical protein